MKVTIDDEIKEKFCELCGYIVSYPPIREWTGGPPVEPGYDECPGHFDPESRDCPCCEDFPEFMREQRLRYVKMQRA